MSHPPLRSPDVAVAGRPTPGGHVSIVRESGAEPPRVLAPDRLPRAPRVAFWALTLLASAWAVVSLWWPIGFDLGLYAWVAGVIRDGGMQYRDAWDMHGPLVGYLIAIADVVFGRDPAGIRVLDLAFLAGGCAGVSRIVRALVGRDAGRWAAVFLTLVYGSLTFNETAQPDGWVALAALAAFAPALIAAAGGRLVAPTALAAAGLASGCFALVKPFYGLLVLVPLTAAWCSGAWPAPGHVGGRTAFRRVIAPTLILAATSAAVVAAAAVWFAANGALAELLDVHLWYTSRVYGGTATMNLGNRAAGVAEFFWRGKVVAVAVPLILVGVATTARLAQRGPAAACFVWVVVGMFCAVMQNKFYYYHWLPTYPPLIVFAAAGAAALLRDARPSPGRTIAVASVTVLAAHAALRPAAYVAHGVLYAAGVHDATTFYGRFEAGPVVPAHQRAAAAYLAARTAPDDGFVVWGYDAGLFYLADRRTPFRLAGWFWPMATGADSVRAAYRREYVRDLRRTRPKYVVVNTDVRGVASIARLESFPEFRAELDREFTRDTTFGPLLLLRRRDRPHGVTRGATPAPASF